ncbi:hypothetical protein R5R35_010151 [Gryllus longicercus]|uniref:UDP-glucuronosyltransferase n=1 Tax=Gryllus longicercus TaxID=2509291 RepID=A0AAN9VC19_9ORTH
MRPPVAPPLPLALLTAGALMAAAPAPGARAARILALFPTPSISHQLPFQVVMKELAARGHQVTVISPDPLKEPVANYTDIDLSFSYEILRNVKMADMEGMSGVKQMEVFLPVMHEIADAQLTSPQIQDFLRNNASQGYDLVFLEWLMYQAYFGIVHAVGAPPLVGIVSLGGFAVTYNAIGNPNNPAYNPEILSGNSDRMTFWERLQNTYSSLYLTALWNFKVFPQQETLMRKHFGEAPPSVYETEYNMSLLILNNHWTLEYPRALLPNVLQLTGLHVREETRPLPADLQAWLDGAEQGVVYFSLGSNVMSKDLPPEKLQAILRALARLPQRVLWKFENDELPGRPPNVRVAKWLPQQDILAHPNVRVFITQGGLQSFQEAVYHAVPLLGIPFIGDQPFNVAKMAAAGVGERLPLADLTEDSLLAALRRLLHDPASRERMRRFSGVYREHKARSLETALWWVEYVLRHEGAPHLRAASLRLAWYELLLLDVAAAVALAALAALLLAAFALRRLWRALRPSTAPAHHARLRKDQ